MLYIVNIFFWWYLFLVLFKCSCNFGVVKDKITSKDVLVFFFCPIFRMKRNFLFQTCLYHNWIMVYNSSKYPNFLLQLSFSEKKNLNRSNHFLICVYTFDFISMLIDEISIEINTKYSLCLMKYFSWQENESHFSAKRIFFFLIKMFTVPKNPFFILCFRNRSLSFQAQHKSTVPDLSINSWDNDFSHFIIHFSPINSYRIHLSIYFLLSSFPTKINWQSIIWPSLSFVKRAWLFLGLVP